MRRAQIILGYLLLVSSMTRPQPSDAATATSTSPQPKKTAKAVRRASQINLKSIDALKEVFERDSGKVRLVTILSPT